MSSESVDGTFSGDVAGICADAVAGPCSGSVAVAGAGAGAGSGAGVGSGSAGSGAAAAAAKSCASAIISSQFKLPKKFPSSLKYASSMTRSETEFCVSESVLLRKRDPLHLVLRFWVYSLNLRNS